MTTPDLCPDSRPRPFVKANEPQANGRTSPSDSEGASSGPPTPNGMPRRRSGRRPKSWQPQPTFHLNIGRVEVPRSLPPVRSASTQTDESGVAEMKREQAVEDAKLSTRAIKWGKKWVWPVVKFVGTAIVFLLGRVGIGFRGN